MDPKSIFTWRGAALQENYAAAAIFSCLFSFYLTSNMKTLFHFMIKSTASDKAKSMTVIQNILIIITPKHIMLVLTGIASLRRFQ